MLFDQQKHLVGWHNIKTNEYKWSNQPINSYNPLAFSGIAVINPEIIELLPKIAQFPIIPEYLKISKYHTISYIKHDPKQWMDVGKPETLKQAEKWYQPKYVY